MDISSTATNTSSSAAATSTAPTTSRTRRLPTHIYIIIPFAILIGLAIITIAVFLFCRQRKRKLAALSASSSSCDLETAQIRGGQRHRRNRSSARSSHRWPWARRTSGAASSRGGVVRRESTEGLNELGEAPPPYHARGLAVESVEDCTMTEVQPIEEFDNGGLSRPMSVVVAPPLGTSWPPTYEPGAIGLAISGPPPAPPSYHDGP